MAFRPFVTRTWRYPKVMLALIILEFPITVALLTLFGIADPDTYRTKLWQNGADQGFNGDPSIIMYAQANYRDIEIPMVWSRFMTKFNVVISVLSTFILLVKVTMFLLHTWLPVISVVIHAALVALYAVSIRNQSAPDLTDPEQPSSGLPWYVSKGCGYATDQNYGYCMQARSSFAVTVVIFAIFVTMLGLSIWSCFPTEAESNARKTDRETLIELRNARYTMYGPGDEDLSKEDRHEKNRQAFLNLPKTPSTPYGGKPAMTPRTVAFTQLEGQQQQAMPTPQLGQSSGPSRPLAFRERYGEEKETGGYY